MSTVNSVDPFGGLGLDVPQTAREGDLGQEDFLHLMLTQLKNQDPFKPMESGEFLGQLAQFGTVQGLAGLQTSFDSLSTSLVSNQALQASTLVGRSALVESDSLAITAGQSVSGAVELDESTSALAVLIRDSLGQPVRTIELGQRPAGVVAFQWDGLAADGTAAPAGRYSFEAAYRSENETVAADTLLRAPIDSVLLGSDGFTVEVRGVGEVPFTAVREIRNEVTASATAAATTN
jgi:flagellar basal-body rod modification protein FlgD